MTFVVELRVSAVKEFDELPRDIQQRFAPCFTELTQDPFRRRPGLNIKRMRGKDLWRIRVGDYRGVYAVVGPIVLFTRFGHRSVVYR